MLQKIQQMKKLILELERDYLAAQSLFAGTPNSTPNKRGWIKCSQCGKSHRAGHPHLK